MNTEDLRKAHTELREWDATRGQRTIKNFVKGILGSLGVFITLAFGAMLDGQKYPTNVDPMMHTAMMWFLLGVPAVLIVTCLVVTGIQKQEFWNKHFELQEQHDAAQAAKAKIEGNVSERLTEAIRMQKEATLRLRAKGVPNNLSDLTKAALSGDTDAKLWIRLNGEIPILKKASSL